ncbi:hypothetical protein DOTSEDRAFT_75007 [Dothistroma septosporum NZE10]|uniref:Mitochondrial transcription factor 1 n=1 Tax=Dothistroma septosporum (strain NZE10 / CBS 128990) TaxID=675120 RepID=N1PE56_DOTSN|nr:hypothetical protein DOTSEDRAFT_75007 [Dothistroma septosporum NZE10]
MSGLSGAVRRYIDPKNPLTTSLAQIFGGFGSYRKPIEGRHARAKAAPIDQYGHGPRTDIVSERLCDDVLRYLAPTLKSYKGCTIIDLNPGACVWSKKLHDLLEPKNHVLMEPEELYVDAFIKPLLDQPGSTYQYSPLSGSALGSYLKNSKSLLDDTGLLPEVNPLETGDVRLRQPQPALLITGNLARKPRGSNTLLARTLSPAHGVLQHHVWMSLSNELFHRGGLARMLWWVPDHEKGSMLPQRCQYVNGYSVGLSLGAQVSEVTGGKPGIAYYRKNAVREVDVTINQRSDGISMESARQVRSRMSRAGVRLPKDRVLLQPQDLLPESRKKMKTPLTIYYHTPERLAKAIDELEARSHKVLAAVKQSRSVTRPEKLFSILDSFMRHLQYPQTLWQPHDEREVNRGRANRHLGGDTKAKYDMSHGALFGSEMRAALILDLFLCIVNLETHYCVMKDNGQDVGGLKDRIVALDEAVRTKYLQDCPNLQQPIELMLDDNLAFYASPQVLAHDKRPYEALQASMDEFWPRAELALLDVVPHPRDLTVPDIATKLDATKAAQDLVRYLYMFKAATLPWALDRMALNAAQDLIPMVPAVTDPRKGGRLNPNNVRVRVLADDMLEGLVKAWFEWPFKPQTWELALAAGGVASSDVLEEEAMTPEAVTDV